MPRADRVPGPQELYEVSISARQRWLESASNLQDKVQYRPPTLANVASTLNGLDPANLGIGDSPGADSSFTVYVVKRDDTLSAIALKFYQDAAQWQAIFAANKGKLENPDRIFVGQSLRIPLKTASVQASA
jgi:nucleoid-associated protein YgaU